MELCPYWNDEDHHDAKHAGDFQSLGAVFFRVLLRMPIRNDRPIVQVCGPITSGGLNDVVRNTNVMRRAIVHLRSNGYHVLDQTPLRPHVSRVWQRWVIENTNKEEYCWEILREIYLPVMESGRVRTYLFIPGWENSAGACWERSKVLSLGHCARDYPEDLYREFLEKEMQVSSVGGRVPPEPPQVEHWVVPAPQG